MSLEAELAKLTAATEKQNSLLEKLLSANTGGSTAAAAPKADAAEKPAAKAKATSAKAKAEKPADDTADAVTVDTLDAKFRPWLAEFPKGHPENDARKAKFKEILGKLGEAKMSAIEDEGKLVKLDNWFENKARTWDEGHGVGRFAADPEAEGGDEDGGEDDL